MYVVTYLIKSLSYWELGNNVIVLYTADITKSLDVKRKRLEVFTQSSLKTSNKKVDEVWKTQQNER